MDTIPANSPAGVISVRGITKSFPGVVANDDISLEIRNGQVHCLLGENGAGKSTLISILAGMQLPDAGTIVVDGKPVMIGSPKIAKRYGIGVVHQHSTLVPSLTVLDNLMLGESGLRLNKTRAETRLQELAELLGGRIDPRTYARDLGLGQQQQVEIAKAMWTGTRLLILDEPTSMLTPTAIDHLAETLRRLKARGLGIIFITHKLREAYMMGDCVTVLRGGRRVGFLTPERLTTLNEEQARVEILQAMFGGGDFSAAGGPREAAELAGAHQAVRDAALPVLDTRPVRLVLDHVSTSARSTDIPLRDIQLSLRTGEILGIAGIDGHGQAGLAEVVAGQRSSMHGTVTLDGTDITGLGVRARQELGVRFVTDDRLHEGTVGNLSVALNLLLKRIGKAPFWRLGRINKAAVTGEADRLIRQYSIRTPSASARAAALSGGNLQKVLLARELGEGAKVVVVNKPTYGLDLRTVHLVHDILRRFAEDGGAVLLISTELDELIEMSHRIVVMSRGTIVGVVDNVGGDVAERVGNFMIGGTPNGHR